MTAIIAWLTGSTVGRYVASGLLIAAVVAVAVWRIFAAGKNAEAAKQIQQSLENLRTRVKTDDEISRLSPDQRRERLRGWVSDGKQ
ncbi:hypothetical protein GCM10007276_12430 [Agaricicola taiwanensis]|uniref:Uncharacterized protein n=1 Tax=Agaricicola taiwanensis TaxID=591372 RepID=A0A8J2VUX9_9RHOB|nr:hypothetical protein [Agaricicola taiwanensis]GGE36437.1 hypothetical protein GCM10007276_12430 [Agaricicola taiwanensis]